MGALEYHPETDPAESEPVNLLQLFGAGEKILNGETVEVIQQLQELYKQGSSPGGARPKVTVAFSEDMKECYSGVCDAPDGFTHWLVKFRSRDDDIHKGAVEKVIADMADIAGIDMSPTKLLTVGDERFFATKRFDRDGNRKIHMHTMAGYNHVNIVESSFDYNDAMLSVGSLARNMEDLMRMYRVAIFNVLVGNYDDHAKNFSFLYDNEWRLAPAYDLTNSFGNYHATTMMGKGMPGKKDMIALAQEHGIERHNETIYLIRHTISQWTTIAKLHDLPPAVIEDYVRRFDYIDQSIFGNEPQLQQTSLPAKIVRWNAILDPLNSLEREILVAITENKSLLGQNNLEYFENAIGESITLSKISTATNNLMKLKIISKNGEHYIIDNEFLAEHIKKQHEKIKQNKILATAKAEAIKQLPGADIRKINNRRNEIAETMGLTKNEIAELTSPKSKGLVQGDD
jgi:hypothetical protein